MKKNNFNLISFTFIALIMTVINVKVHAQTTKLTGTWNFSVETTAGSGSPTFIFTQETDTSFTGTYKGQLGEAPVKGTIKGKEVKFSFSVNDNLIEYTGIWEGNNLKGSVKLGSMAEGTFSAIKKE